MSCVLRIMGKDFDPDEFVSKSKLQFDNKTYKGEVRFKTKPEGVKFNHSVLSVVVSNADFNSPELQIEDAKNYLVMNKQGLNHIVGDRSIEHAFLDFGLNFNTEKINQSIYLPYDLVKLAGELGIGIEISLYNNDRFE